MFHLMLVLPALVAFGAVAIFMLAAPLCFGIVLQLIFCLIGQTRWVFFIPLGLGAVGLALSLAFLLESISVWGILLYWAFYALCLWLVWLIVSQGKKAAAKWRVGK